MYLIKQTKQNKIKYILSALVVCILVFTSCNKNGDPEVTAPLDPYLSIDGTSNLSIDASGGTRSVALKANGNWQVSVPGDIDWVEVDPKNGKDNGTFNLTIYENTTYDTRSAKLSFRLNDASEEGVSFQIVQTGAVREVTYETLLEEDFDWLVSGNGVIVGLPILYDQSVAELRIDLWPASFTAHGWESDGANAIYAREGLLKIGKSGSSDYIVSPPLEFEGTKNLKIEFKAVPYITAANNRDNGQIKVGTTQEEAAALPSSFSLDNWFDMASDPQTIEIWKKPESVYSFEVKGATSGIRIKIGSEGNKQRFFVDDVIIKMENE